ncbi:MAG TPA: hypothetical protein VNE38_06725 [Ktedonobacteraceae bacterium]|nr:hypothetical protein [Ktedonobacteraceae bacterium]
MQQIRGRTLLWLFLLGATLGTALDAYHVYSHVERYSTPTLIGVAWWVPLLFGCAAMLIGYSHLLVDPLLYHRRFRPLFSSLLGLAWLPLAYLICASFFDTLTKTALVLLVYFNFWLLAGSDWQNLVFSLITAISGTLVEMILVAAGAFSYVHPDLLGVPYWLPGIYACASLALGDLGRSLTYNSGGSHESR